MGEHHEKKRLENPPKSIKFKIQRREREGADAYWETFELRIPPQPERNLGADGDPQESGHGRRQKDNTAGLGHVLSRTGMRDLHDGNRREACGNRVRH